MSIPRLLHGEDARVGGGRLDETYLAELEDRSDDLATRRIRELPQSTQSVIESALGGVPERSNGAVSKTVVRVSGPWVRIPPPPPGLAVWLARAVLDTAAGRE